MNDNFEITYSVLIRHKTTGEILYLKSIKHAKWLGNQLSHHYDNHWQIHKRKFNWLHPWQKRYYLLFDIWAPSSRRL